MLINKIDDKNLIYNFNNLIILNNYYYNAIDYYI